jgi:hypothetical protein
MEVIKPVSTKPSLPNLRKEFPMLNIKPMLDKKGVFWFLDLTFGLT